jgi:tRNA-binding protein
MGKAGGFAGTIGRRYNCTDHLLFPQRRLIFMETSTSEITFEDFQKVEMRVGTVLSAEVNAKANKPAYVLTVDFGEFGIKTSSAQLTVHYQPQELIGRQVVGVLNFPPRRIAGIKSEVLVLGAPDEDGAVVLLAVERSVPNGARIF